MNELVALPARTVGRAMRRCSTATWGSARWQQGFAAAIAALVFWPESSADAVVGIDPSWQAGLAMAQAHDLAWGPEIVFTYGPLGFLQTAAYYSYGQSLLATIYQPIVVATLFLGIATILRQRHAPMTSLIVAFLTTGITTFLHIGHGWGVPGLEYPELAVLAAFAWGAAPLLQRDPGRSMVFVSCLGLGVAAGFQLLVKFDTGVTIALIALSVSVLLDWRAVGRHCATVGAFAASTLILWALAGQRLGDLPGWFRSSVSLLLGYSEAVAVPLNLFSAFVSVLILAWMGVLCVMFFRGSPEIPRSFVVFVGLVTVILAKKAFVRFDEWRLYPVLALIVVAVVITPLVWRRRRAFRMVSITIVLVLVGIPDAGKLALGYPSRVVAAAQAPFRAVNRLVSLAFPGHVEQRIEEAKARQRALYAIPDRFIETIGSATVHLDPDQTSAVWAYDLTWRPVPDFQTYAAYTPALDALNSESLVTGPQFVLSRLSPASPAIGPIDGRLSVQQSPRYSRSLLCNYTVKDVADRWALFEHTGPRCGPLTPVSEVTIRAGEMVGVPAPSRPDVAVLVGIDLQPTIIDQLFQGAIVPLTIPTLALDGVDYRLISANAAEPFLVNSPASVDGTDLQIRARTIGVGRAPTLGQAGIIARLRFYEMPVAS
ncbi:hypothetical protein ORI20_26905 [Mycobacterium sp. CVI_P3]|uniref:Transmembrane protein n=1 Tax=Mycobacterium pinniadriaticum TaxID=2994102 RepID=A0ABT3SNF6_9MYCO|nr:hypothetical protein [Mycobacterium pinniadriaticum]MCX2933905.1 hypothetical protein [Mycobacterium pinniadriaticum]MCX2940327.1 hypothetical protein [Mycobacterium pinniadriaticum]